MPAAETAFEYMALALEATPGTAVTPPTHYLPLLGSITPDRERYSPDESRGTLVQNYRRQAVHIGSTWEGSGGLDPNYAPLLANMVIKGGVTAPTTPSGATLSRLWTFVPTVTSDNLKSATIYNGDPNVKIWQAVYCMAQEWTISADASGTDAATMAINGFGRFPTALGSAPTLPSQNIGSLLMPSAMQLWIDTSSAIGTTEVTGRFISADITIPAGVSQKWYAGGPTGGLNYTKHGRSKRAASATVTVELNDVSVAAEYTTWAADTTVKMRIRLNGSLIETTAGPVNWYEYVEFDIYGPLDAFGWGTAGDPATNRTMSFTVESMYDSTLGADFALKVQNSRTTL